MEKYRQNKKSVRGKDQPRDIDGVDKKNLIETRPDP